ncbi:hypothetical protein OPIT5_09685 [Opitutaceae bacterium TAV5]|nr:hypothetical protein OPIT5_09685 [Opitutaceae bacterium TAV5]
MKNKIQSSAIAVSTAAALLAAFAIPSTRAALIFEADFASSSQIVSIGGTGVVNAGDANWSASIEDTNSLGQGSYLNRVNNGSGSATTSSYVADFTPTSAANSWAAMSTVSGANVVLNGGADLFFRVNSVTDASKVNWFRPIDTRGRGTTDTSGLRLVLNANSATTFTLELLAGGGAAFTDKTTGNTSSSVKISAPLSYTFGAVNHIGFTFSTDDDGWVTMKLFTQADGDAIDITGASLPSASTATFKISSSIAGNGFANSQLLLGGGDPSATASNIDYDLFRLYDSAPSTFSSIPEPSTAALLTALPALLLVVSMRRRRILR